MSWKFWAKKKKEEINLPTDLYAFAIFAGTLFARNGPPFDDWREPTIDVPVPLNYLFQRVAQGFQVWAWTVLVNDKYGIQASRLALDAFCLQAARKGGAPDARVLSNFVVHAGNVAGRAAKSAESDETQKGARMPWTYFAAMDMLISTPEQPYYNKVDSEFDGNEVLLDRCIAHATDRASIVFDVMLRNVRYTPDTFMEWLWSTRPNGYERHLQRRWDNPLFPEERRKVTATDVYHAWVQDGAAMDELKAKVNNFLKAQPDDLPLEWQSYCNETRAKVDELFEEAYKVGGDISEIVDILQKIRDRAMNTWKAGLDDNKEALANLELAELEHNKYGYLDNAFVHEACNRDIIPLEELVQALLCEPIENIQAYCKYLISINDKNPIPTLRNVADEIITDAHATQIAQGVELTRWDVKLEAIDSYINITKEDLMC